MCRLRGLVVWGIAALAVMSACAKKTDHGFYQEEDFLPPKGKDGDPPPEAPVFDRNNVIETATLVDADALDAEKIQTFFHRTPYGRGCFLETYQSNGIRASDAVAQAARTYKINPLAILVAVQGTQGLIGESLYPTAQPYRVEYLFRCGCLQGAYCLPELAGFDRQVECMARSLRAAFDQIAENDVTAGGWGRDKESLTLDGATITPANDGTAVVYDRSPRVAQGEAGGTWFFWNLLNVYAASTGYSPPTGDNAGTGWIGDKCVSAANCGFDGALCDGNRCTAKCTGECPSDDDKPPAFCADSGFCYPICNEQVPGSCRKGFKCVRVKPFGTTHQSTPVCTPQ